jgi:hypothetical protein
MRSRVVLARFRNKEENLVECRVFWTTTAVIHRCSSETGDAEREPPLLWGRRFAPALRVRPDEEVCLCSNS